MKKLTILHYWTLLSFGVHIGHSFSNSFVYTAWAAYIYLQPHDLVILNLFKSVIQARTGFLAIGAACEHSGPVWFINLDPINRYYDRYTAEYCGEFNWRGRWVHGALANFTTIGPLIYKLMDTPRLWHNARQRWFVGDAKYWMFSRLSWPRVVFTKSVHKSQPPAVESHFLGIPCFGVVDSNAYSHTASIAFPGNDDSISCLIFYHHMISNFILYKKMKLAIAWYKNIRSSYDKREQLDISLLNDYNTNSINIDKDLDKLQFVDCNAFEEFEFKAPALMDAWQNFPLIDNNFSILKWLKEWHIIAEKLCIIKAMYKRSILYSGHPNQKYHLNRYFWGHCWINDYFNIYKTDRYVKNLNFIKRKYKAIRYNYTYGHDYYYYAQFINNYIAYKYLQYRDIPNIHYYGNNNEYFYTLKTFKYLGMGNYDSDSIKINSILPIYNTSKYSKYLEYPFKRETVDVRTLIKNNYLNTFMIKDYITPIFTRFFKPSPNQSEFIDCGKDEYFNVLNKITSILYLISGGNSDYHYTQIYNTYFLIMHTYQLVDKGYFDEEDAKQVFPLLTKKLRIERFYYFIDPAIYTLLDNLWNAFITLFDNLIFDKKIFEKIQPKLHSQSYQFFYAKNIRNLEYKFRLEGFYYRRKLKMNLKSSRSRKKNILQKAIYDNYINSLEYNLFKILLIDFSLKKNNRHNYIKLYNNLYNQKFFFGLFKLMFRKNKKFDSKYFDLNQNMLLKNNILTMFYRNLLNQNKASYLLLTHRIKNFGLIIDDLYYFFKTYFMYSKKPLLLKPYMDSIQWFYSTDGTNEYRSRFDIFDSSELFYKRINKNWIPYNINSINKLRFKYFNLFPFVKFFLQKFYRYADNDYHKIHVMDDAGYKKIQKKSRNSYIVEGLKYMDKKEWLKLSLIKSKYLRLLLLSQIKAQAILIHKSNIGDRKTTRAYRYIEFDRWRMTHKKLYKAILASFNNDEETTGPSTL